MMNRVCICIDGDDGINIEPFGQRFGTFAPFKASLNCSDKSVQPMGGKTESIEQ